MAHHSQITFEDVGLLGLLQLMPHAGINRLSFGVVELDSYGIVSGFNAVETSWTGLQPVNVLGRHFFIQIARCFNNEAVAGKFEAARIAGRALDIRLVHGGVDYVQRPYMWQLDIRLRLLADKNSLQKYILIDRNCI
jgi:photoactive yellow protein